MNNGDVFDPIPTPEPLKRVESRLSAWWSAWKYVAILALLLLASIVLNVRQYGTNRSAKANCRAQMVEAAKAGIELERKRAAEAEKQAAGIADDTKREARADARKAQEGTNEREHRIQGVRTTGACVMPRGLPALSDAVDAANAAGRD